MIEVLYFFSLISQKQSRQYPAKHSSAMSPIVNSRDKKTKYKNSNGPTAYLLIDRLPELSAPAFSEVERRADKAANCSRSSQGKRDSSGVRRQITSDPAQRVNRKHPVAAVFLDNQRAELPQSYHIEKYVQNASVQVVGAKYRPPAMKLVDRDCSRRSEEQQAFGTRRKKTQWVGGKTDGGRMNENRQNEHGGIDRDDVNNDPVRAEQTFAEGNVFPARSRISQTAVGTMLLVCADKPSAVWTKYRISV